MEPTRDSVGTDGREAQPQAAGAETADDRPFIVGIGASAGGLEALERLFKNMPSDSGLAFVVIQHLSPDFKSLMDELLARHTRMTIHRVEDGMEVEANSIYLIPPKKEMIISGRRLLLTDKDPDQELSLPIDHFFRSLAQDVGRCAVAIVLSGTGSDGSRGIRDVHEAGGLVIAQSEETAKFDGMPKSAKDTGVVDLILPPEEMPQALVQHLKHTRYNDSCTYLPSLEEEAAGGFGTIFKLLRDEYGIDFSHYKPNTVTRRIDRRVSLIQARNLDEYVSRVESDPAELNALYKDLLIGVTRFFRDREAFERLEQKLLPELLAKLPPEEEIRVWVAGCATGEEAYSLAILLHERLQLMGRRINMKIFAGDVHKASLEIASTGVYEEAALADVTPARLARYFTKRGDGYQVSNELRQLIVFARHNVIKDAPFTKLHLISCRNLLIYFQPQAQKKALSLFHFGLKTGGLLFLGPSETPGELVGEFDALDDHWKIYRKRRDVRLPADMRLPLTVALQPIRSGLGGMAPTGFDGALMNAYDRLLEEHMPPGLLVSDHRQLVHTFGDAGRYLQHRSGRPTADILDQLEGDLKMALAGALQRAAKEQTPVSYSGIRARTLEGEEQLRLAVQPIHNRHGNLTHFFIALESLGKVEARERTTAEMDVDEASRQHVSSLETELRYTRENLQATIEELETSNEELQASNEELVASNEELQSTNEELHSVNEELYTVNAEYQKKIVELTELTDDMDNLLRATDIGTIFLDRHLCIRKFTPQIGRAFDLLPQDVGRKIDNFSHGIQHPGLISDLKTVLESGKPIEKEVQDRAGNWFFLRVLPYKSHSKLDGVVLSLIDVSALKNSELQLAQRDRLSAMRANIGLSMVRDEDLRTILQNCAENLVAHLDAAFARIWTLDAGDDVLKLQASAGQYTHLNGPHSRIRVGDFKIGRIAAARTPLLTNNVPDDEQINDRDWARREGMVAFAGFPLVVGERVVGVLGLFARHALAQSVLDDLRSLSHEIAQCIDRKSAESALKRYAEELRLKNERLTKAEAEARDSVDKRDQFLAMLSHELRNPLAAVLNAASLLEWNNIDKETMETARGAIARQSQHMARLLDDLLEVSRITRGKIAIRKAYIDLVRTSRDAIEAIRPALQAKELAFETELSETPLTVCGDPTRLQQIQVNLLANAIKYTPPGGRIWLSTRREGNEAVICVRDTGLGIPESMLDKIFDLFVQVDDTPGKADGGMGVGLTLVRTLVQLHDGRVQVHSEGEGKGSEFIVRLPLYQGAVPTPAEDDGKADLSGLRVVLVEDHADIRMVTGRLLKAVGCEVIHAEDGEQGIAAVCQQQPDVALIDIGLPDVNGYEVARRIRRRPEAEGVRLLALTGFGQPEDRQKALEAGFDDHLVKPLQYDALMSVIRHSPLSCEGEGGEHPV